MRPRPGRLEAVTFNGWVGQGPAEGAANVAAVLEDTGNPHVAALQEAHWLAGPLLEDMPTPLHRYRVHRPAGDREARNIALLIRRDLTVHNTGLLHIRHARWTGPKHGRRHDPRIMPWAEVSLPGERRRWCVLAVHRITSTGGRNAPQRAAEADQIEAWLKAHRRRHPWRPSVALGDWNGRPVDIAGTVGASLSLAGVDGALTLAATVTRRHELRLRYGSDSHNPVGFTIARD